MLPSSIQWPADGHIRPSWDDLGGIDSFTAPLHSPNSRQGVCLELSVVCEKQWKFPPVTWTHNAAYPECTGTGIPRSIFRLANHTSDDTANHRPYLIPPWQSSSYQARTVKQSIKRQQGTVGSPEIDSIADPEGFLQKLNWSGTLR